MASGKETPRQKMINLMYLVFIAMLALNMSKEVLTAFGLMNEQVVESNMNATERNKKFKQGLDEKANEQPGKYLTLKNKADSISNLADNLYNHLESIKTSALDYSQLEDVRDYEVMDKPDAIDEMFFVGDGLTPQGDEFLSQMKVFREGVAEILKSNLSLQDISDDVIKKFSTNQVTDREGVVRDWIEYHYMGYPLVASLTKFTMLQADLKTIESELLSAMLQGKLKIEASLTNFDAIVVPDKTAFFSGDNFTGRIILGKNDNMSEFQKNNENLIQKIYDQDKEAEDYPIIDVNDSQTKQIKDNNYQYVQELDSQETLSLHDKELELIKKSLERHEGKRKLAAKELGISERTLYRKIKQFDL